MVVASARSWQTRRLANSQRCAMGVRVVSGAVPGFRTRWRHGVATLAPGRIAWRKGFLGTVWVPPWAATLSFSAVPLDSSIREATASDLLRGLRTDTVTFKVASGDTLVECAVMPEAIQAVLRRLAGVDEGA